MKRYLLVLLIGAMALGFIQGRRNAQRVWSERVVRVVRSAAVNSPRPISQSPGSAAHPWQALESRDYHGVISSLRASGCPEETIRDLVLMRVTRDLQRQLCSVMDQRHLKSDWWRSEDWNAVTLAEVQAARHLRRAADDNIYDLLGGSYVQLRNELLGLPWMQAVSSDDWLPLEKRRSLAVMRDRFQDEKEALVGFGPVRDPTQKEQLAELEKRQRAELEAFLTPNELLDYDARNSRAAEYVRQHLPPAQNEKEFRTMVAIAQQAGAEPFGPGFEWGADRAEVQRARDLQKESIMRKVAAVLGEDAVAVQRQAAEEQKARDAADQEVKGQEAAVAMFSDMAESVGVDRAVGRQMVDRFKQLSEEFNAKYPNPADLTEAQKKQVEAEILARVEQVAVELMGEKGHEFVKKFKEQTPGH